MDYKNLTNEQKIVHILEALSRENLSVELTELIHGWILSEKNSGKRDEVMDAILDRMFQEHRHPTSRALESLARLHEKLELPEINVKVKQRGFPRRTFLRAAAVFLPFAVLGGALWYVLRPVPDTVYPAAMVEMARGEDGMLTLPDGSTVRSTDGSRVMITENFAEDRRVSLSGEAFFSVAHDAGRPFSVETDGLIVTVLGTEFNLKADPEEDKMVVSLVTGSVEIDSGNQKVVLEPMEQFVYDEATGESEVSQFSLDQIDRWRSGRRELNDISLEQALAAVGDFYDMTVVISGSLPKELNVTTVLRDNITVESVLDAIGLMNNAFEYEIEGVTIYIVGKK